MDLVALVGRLGDVGAKPLMHPMVFAPLLHQQVLALEREAVDQGGIGVEKDWSRLDEAEVLIQAHAPGVCRLFLWRGRNPSGASRLGPGKQLLF